jgi:hypothetical protein
LDVVQEIVERVYQSLRVTAQPCDYLRREAVALMKQGEEYVLYI